MVRSACLLCCTSRLNSDLKFCYSVVPHNCAAFFLSSIFAKISIMSKQQNYKNHIRFYTPHHFIFYPVATALLFACIKMAVTNEPLRSVWLMLAAVIFMMSWLSYMLRQHYALGNQNRIVRLEMRLRYYQLTGERFEPLEGRLSFGQIAALRFASDEELVALLQKTLQEHLAPDEIKRSINNWLPDEMRA